MTDLAQQIEQLMPKSLDDIIRANRHVAELRLATEAEVMQLHYDIEPRRLEPENCLGDWRFIALHRLPAPDHGLAGDVQVMLLGEKQFGGAWITSQVRQIDLDRQLVITNSGTLYGLGNRGEGEPPFGHLACLCAGFHKWGFGDIMGVPHFFY